MVSQKETTKQCPRKNASFTSKYRNKKLETVYTFFFTLPKIVISIYNKAAKKKKNKMMHGTIFYFQQDIFTEEL